MDHTEKLILKPLTNINKPEQESANAPINIPRQPHIDETDKRIAKILAYNARTPFKQIAQQVGISTKNVIQRYERLKGSLLTLSTITVNLKKL